MKIKVLLVTFWCVAFGQNYDHLSGLKRRKRDAVGALDIVTNNAQPIHAEVKPENAEVTEKVTPPKAAVYESKSLRKSLPLNSRLDLIRGISRIVTLTVLAISAVFEFYPIVRQTYDTIVDIMYKWS